MVFTGKGLALSDSCFWKLVNSPGSWVNTGRTCGTNSCSLSKRCRLHCDDLIGLMITQGQREGTASLQISLVIFRNIQCNLCIQWDNCALSWLLASFFFTSGAIPGLSLELNPQTAWKRDFWERLTSSVSQEMEQLQVSHAEGQRVLLLPHPGGTNPALFLALLCHQTFWLYTNNKLSLLLLTLLSF